MERYKEMLIRAKENSKSNKVVSDIKCTVCGDTGFIIKKIEGNEFATQCKCQRNLIFENRLRASGLTTEDLNVRFTDFDCKNNKCLAIALFTAKHYRDTFEQIQFSRHNSMLLSGSPGKGKTHLGMATASSLFNNGTITMRYLPYRAWISKLKKLQFSDEEQYNREILDAKTTKLLFIDDLYKGGNITPADINIVYEVIDHRYIAKMPTIITTEKSIDELIAIDEAIGSRIVDMCKEHTILFDDTVKNHRLE